MAAHRASEEKFLFHRRVSRLWFHRFETMSLWLYQTEERERRRVEESLLRSHVNSGEGI